MGEKSYRFKLGAFECVVVTDGTHVYEHPASLLFANAPQDELEQVLREHNIDPASWAEWPSPYPSLVIDTGDHRVLIDTGAGGSLPGTGELLPNLRAAGIVPADIDTVLLTHGHADHVGGCATSEGRPAFPNARYVIGGDEWRFWAADEPDLSPLPFPEQIRQLLIQVAHGNLLPLKSRFDLVESEEEIVPGVRVLPAPGHTPGHMAVAISSDGKELLCPADAMLHPIHLEQPGWYAGVDLAPEQALEIRRQLLQRAVDTGALLHVFHFAFPGLGRVIQQGEAWKWQPIAAA